MLKQLRNSRPDVTIFGTSLHKSGKLPFDQRVSSTGNGVVNAEGTQLPFKSRHFDLVLASRVFPFVADKARFLEETHRVLKKGGVGLVDNLGPFRVRGRRKTAWAFKALNQPEFTLDTSTRRWLLKITKAKHKLKLPLRFREKLSTGANIIRGATAGGGFQSTYTLTRRGRREAAKI